MGQGIRKNFHIVIAYGIPLENTRENHNWLIMVGYINVTMS